MRAVVVGIGGVGAMAAWRLAKAGVEVIGLEQFALDHDRGSSYGDSRIVRRVYPDALYTALMAHAYSLWEELQAQSDEERFAQAGGIYCGPADHPLVLTALAALAASAVPYRVLDAEACRARFPAFVLQANEVALFEPSMGYARASLCVRAACWLARQIGATIEENCPVAAIESGKGGGVRVTTQAGTRYEADRLILTPGPWAKPLLAQLGVALPLTVTRQPYLHLLPAQNPDAFRAGRFPVWIDAHSNTYGFPTLGAVPGVKIGLHDHGAAVSPETVERSVQESDCAPVREYAARRFPWLSAQAVYAQVCLYTNTPDEDFIVDTVPGLPDALLISACSGHGYKFTPLLGEVAARWCNNESLPFDLARFRLNRFLA
jgi:monomeric sarcosine oxidase